MRILILILASIITIGVLQYISSSNVDTTTNAIALLALLLSLVSAFKSSIYPFGLSLISTGVIVVRPDEAGVNHIQFLFPICFVNNNYGEGVVEYVCATIRHENGNSIRVIPIAEVPESGFIQNGGKIDLTSVRSAFWPFPLKSKQATRKTILMGEPNPPNSNLSIFETPGNFEFSLYVRIGGKSKPVKKTTFTRNWRKNDTEMLKSGYSVTLVTPDPDTQD